MNRRIPLTAAGIGGGMLAATFLSTATAAAGLLGDAATDGGSEAAASALTLSSGAGLSPGEDAFSDGPDSTFGDAPLLEFQNWSDQSLDVVNADGEDAGSVLADVDASNIFGIESTQMTIDGTDGINIGTENGSDNVYDAFQSADIDAADFTGDKSDLTDAASAIGHDEGVIGDLADGDEVDAEQVTGALDSADIDLASDADEPDSSAISDAISGEDGGLDIGDDADLNGDDSFDASNVSDALADKLDLGADDISGDDVVSALADSDELSGDQLSDLGIDGDGNFDDANVADGISFDPSEVADNINGLDGVGTDGAASADDITDAVNGLLNDFPDGIEDGAVYNVTDLGLGIANVYEAVPDGDGGSDISDTLVTPLGSIDLSTPFDALADIGLVDVTGDDGVDASTGLFGGLFDGGLFSGVSDFFDDVFDGGLLGGIFGGDEGSDAVNDDASSSEIASVLSDSSTDFNETGTDDVDASDIGSALADGDGTDVLGGDVGSSDVSDVLSNIDDFDPSEAGFDASDIAEALNGADVVDGSEGADVIGDVISSIFG